MREINRKAAEQSVKKTLDAALVLFPEQHPAPVQSMSGGSR
jgi:hypothetical protein